MASPAYKSQLTKLFVVPVFGLSLLAAVLAYAVYRLERSDAWVDHTDQVIATLSDVQRFMVDVEDGVRGYLLTGKETYLAPERSNTLRIREHLQRLQMLVDDNGEQSANARELGQNYEAWERNVLPLGSLTAATPEVKATLDRTRDQMENLRAQVNRMRDTEERLREERVSSNKRILRAVYWLSGLLTVLTGVVIAVWSFRTARSMNRDYEKRLREARTLHEELREKNELVDLAQATANAGFWHFDVPTSKVILTPGCKRLFGLGLSESLTLEDVFARIVPEDRERVRRAFEDAVASGRYFAEFRVPCEDGTVRWLLGQARTLSNAAGEAHMIGVNFDITQQKLAEEALRRNEKLAVVGRMAAAVSHEINNPLESVTNLLYLIENGGDAEEQREFAKLAQQELSRVSHIVSHTLKFHRESSNSADEDIGALLDSALALYEPRIIALGLTLVRDYRVDTLVRCYGGEMRQVFANLIGNAFDATRAGGKIIIRTNPCTAEGKPAMRVTIADTGSGMSAFTRSRLFEPFYTTKGINGTGLGLWVTASILKKHNAKLQVKSRLGQGTVFSVVLPVEAVGAPRRETEVLSA